MIHLARLPDQPDSKVIFFATVICRCALVHTEELHTVLIHHTVSKELRRGVKSVRGLQILLREICHFQRHLHC